MGSTRIINVQKNDSFDDVFDFFRNIDAKEIIFIFPKGSKIAKHKGHFQLIKEEAEKTGKLISVMTSDPEVIRQASDFGIQLLNSGTSSSTPRPAKHFSDNDDKENDWQPITDEDKYSIDSGDDPDDRDSEIEIDSEEESDKTETEEISAGSGNNDMPIAELAAAGVRFNAGRTMMDVIRPRPGRNLSVKEEVDDTFDINISRQVVGGRSAEKDITKVWEHWGQRDRYDHDPGSPGGQYGEKLKSARNNKLIWTVLTGTVLILILFIYGTLAKATVIIRLRQESVSFQLKITASSAIASVNEEFNRIPGQLFSVQKEESGEFPVTGNRNIVQKASGRITIYSKNPAAQRLVATTRFESPRGLVFRISETITVPPAVKVGAEVLLGSIESAVSADKPGSEYNIGSANFTITAFKGTSKFDEFYAVSDQPMSGGQIGEAKTVTASDFSKASESLTNKLRDLILKSLRSQSGQLKIIDSAAIKFEDPVINAEIDESPRLNSLDGNGTDDLKMTIKGSAQTIGFKESDVRKLIDNFESENGGLELIDKGLSVKYLDPVYDSANKAMKFTIQVTGMAAAKIEREKIIKELLGLDESSIRIYFGGLKEVESASVALAPFWIKKIPRDAGKVRLLIKVD